MQIDTNILKTFGKNVRKHRREKGLSQEELAFKANLHRTYIGMIERAEKKANALEVNIKELFDEAKQ